MLNLIIYKICQVEDEPKTDAAELNPSGTTLAFWRKVTELARKGAPGFHEHPTLGPKENTDDSTDN